MASYNLGTAAGRIVIDGSGAEKGFGVAKAAAGSFSDAVSNQMDAVDKLANRLLLIGTAGSGAMALAANSAAAFQQRLSAIEAVSGATEEQMKAISTAALRIGADSVYSATESAMAMEELIKAGLSVEDVLNGAADATVNLAAAGEVALPRAAEIAANAMNNFNLSGEDMPRIADLIAGAANASAIDVEQFGMSMSQAGAVSALVGLSFEDMAVAIAEMGNAGIKGSDAGTSLKTMLMNLIPGTDKQIKKFKELQLYTVNVDKSMQGLNKLGIKPLDMSFDSLLGQLEDYVVEADGLEKGSEKAKKAALELGQQYGVLQNEFFDTEGNVKSLEEIQGILADTTKDMTSEQKLMNLEVLFGSDAIRAAAVMSKEGADGYNAMAEAMGNVTAAEVAETRMNNLRGAVEQLSGAWETLTISIGTYFLKPMQRATEALTKVIDILNAAPDWLKAAAASFISIGTAVAVASGIFLKLIPIVVTLGARMLGLAAVRQVFGIFSAGARAMMGGQGVVAAMGLMSTRVAALGGWLSRLLSRSRVFLTMAGWVARFGAAIVGVLTGPVGWIILAVTALGVAGKILYDKWEPFRNLCNEIGAAIKDFFVPAAEAAMEAWNNFTAGLSGENTGALSKLSEIFNTLGLGLRGLVEAFKNGDVTSDGFVGVMERLGVALRGAWDRVVELGRVLRDEVWPIIKQVGTDLKNTFIAAWDTLVDSWNNDLFPALKELWTTIQDKLIPGVKDLATALWPVIKVVLQVAAALLGGLLFGLYKVAMFILQEVLPVLITFTAWLIGVLVKAIAQVGAWIVSYLITPLVQLVNWIVGSLIPAIVAFGSAIFSAFSAAYEWVKSAIEGIIGWFQSLSDGAKEGADAAGSAFSGIVVWIQNAWNQIVAILSAVVETLIAPWVAVYTFLAPFISGMFAFIGSLINLAITVWVSIIQVAWAVITVIFEVALTLIWGIIVNIGRFIEATWSGIWSAVQWVAQIAWDLISALFRNGADIISAIWNGIATATSAVWNFIYGIVSGIMKTMWSGIEWYMGMISNLWSAAWGAVKGVIDAVWGAIGPTVTSKIDAVKTKISSTLGLIKSGWDTGWNALSDKITEIWTSIKTKIDDAISNVKGAFDDAGTWLKQAGKDIIDGLTNGIKEKAQAAVDAVKNVGSNLVSGIKGVLNIGSPSKVMHQIGNWTTEGLENGLLEDTASLTIAAGKLGSMVVQGATPDLSGYSSGASTVSNVDKTTNINVVWNAAPNDEVSTRQQVKNMLGKTSRLSGNEMRIN